MKGSTVDAMSDAVDNAELMLSCISLAYKGVHPHRGNDLCVGVAHSSDQVFFVAESANCRLELQYGHQQDVAMVPLMMEKGYRPNGWLGLLLGTRL